MRGLLKNSKLLEQTASQLPPLERVPRRIFDEVERATRSKDVAMRMMGDDDLLTAAVDRGLATPERQQTICSSSSLNCAGLACVGLAVSAFCASATQSP